MTDNNQSKKWYRQNRFIILALFIFSPLGVFLMWRYSDWPIARKWLYTLYAGLGLLVLPILFWLLSNY
ncbi:hypothetical protein COX95_01855 [bacterium CG_4_10_14_0_2_um_filter_33_32]|nr:MAG: hypothetical protein AUJ93_04300 [bacterium CG2_30_33_46]PIR67729.1 MAG: hypothetical protein COU50_01705 [bacterium CG10_big_fil_rev_8_21_14_0_10_33_18]PIU77208.1 MAG: hypothetical protein COS74_00130 [bacterium CG06_land_8_20_14_3_00_33_50]PIW80973.1 MAG: hypothetical protein COZ97_04115 [bacterium CG_4_8_14_3_um_filter_33_28]PIY85289.1 MAG: hypothetical protein COY76_03060 [bacterium CG_4_10_14_0_8_um_filter_33_57]PIZ86184.1 MAG: hypothetical protein COX95_01855 [bacterium CG_4_10_1